LMLDPSHRVLNASEQLAGGLDKAPL